MKVLLVDDEELGIKGIRDYCVDSGWECSYVGFDACYKEILVFNPDIVVLDWYENGNQTGEAIIKSIWENGYRPVVIFSGLADMIELSPEYKSNDFVRLIKKGNEEEVTKFINDNKEYITVLSAFRGELGKSLIESFAAIKPIQAASDSYLGDSVVKYMLAKRAVGFFDLENEKTLLPPWGIYTAPAVSKCLSTCDIIRKYNQTKLKNVGLEKEYKMVLTPSCDMYHKDGRKPKVKKVMCAPCMSKKAFFKNSSLIHSVENIENGELKKDVLTVNIQSALNQGYTGRWIALPKMEGVCPAMSVDVKNIELINLDEVAANAEEINEQTEYIRVASIDSPFSQQYIWAFMQNACRPGVPDRDTEQWAKLIQE